MGINKRVKIVAASGVGLAALAGALFAGYATTSHASPASTNPYVLSSNYLASHHAKAGYAELGPQGAAKGEVGKVNHGHPTSNGIGSYVDGVSNWDGTWNEAGYNPDGSPNSTWYYNMIGNPPQSGKTTTFDAPVIPVKLVLLGENNQPAFTVDPEKDVQPTLNSPIFQDTKYSSSDKPTQFGDAVQRAEFSGVMKNSWHTLLAPSLKPEVTLTIPYGEYFVGLNTDGTIAYTLVDYNTFSNAMFPATAADLPTSVIGQEELNGTMTTKNVSTFLFDNTYLYEGNINNCCVLGFHGPDYELSNTSTGLPLENYAMIYASWITPGLFGGDTPDDAPQDVTALSHEVSETFNDPFSAAYAPYATTPWWQSSFNCQDNFEVGDVIEGLPKDNTVIPMNGFNYHVQNEALLSWFEGPNQTNIAINGAYSYPDESTLTSPAISMQPDCTGPAQ